MFLMTQVAVCTPVSLYGKLKDIVVHDISRTYVCHLTSHVAVTCSLIGSDGSAVVLVYGEPYLADTLTATLLFKVSRHLAEQSVAAELFLKVHLAEIKRIVLSHLNAAIAGISAILRDYEISVSVVVYLVFQHLVRLKSINHILYLSLTYNTGKGLAPYRSGHSRYSTDIGISAYFSYHSILF